jgi:hypothetical protein
MVLQQVGAICTRWYASRDVLLQGSARSLHGRITRSCATSWKDHKKLCDVMVSAQAEDAKLGAKATEKENLSHSN